MIGIIDYGVGNVTAFMNAYIRLGVGAIRASTPDDIARCSHLILPGVGAFDHAMIALNESGLRPYLEDKVFVDNVPVLGICVGMQMLSRGSEEGAMSGLGWVDAEVKSMVHVTDRPLPHMGWNRLLSVQDTPVFQGLDSNPHFYFLHSYYVMPMAPSAVLAYVGYGTPFPSVIQHGNIFGMQCHPEKSHGNGERFLHNFARL